MGSFWVQTSLSSGGTKCITYKTYLLQICSISWWVLGIKINISFYFCLNFGRLKWQKNKFHKWIPNAQRIFSVRMIVWTSSQFFLIDFSCQAGNFHFKLVTISKILITVSDLNGSVTWRDSMKWNLTFNFIRLSCLILWNVIIISLLLFKFHSETHHYLRSCLLVFLTDTILFDWHKYA